MLHVNVLQQSGNSENLMSSIYSPSHIVQITLFLEILHEFCKEKIETFTEF